eukprot:Blabericola_migrator_1__2470@NODE_1698_length_3980_cov_284_047278_g1099_i0_p2_GENE_NODE_1698_length_3980_cov_284_047278_g1099_i0NODE_1698_length_3980_cov_284_047278_g1099_i0_p2_ORF_typecomplete_len416_score65_36Ribonuc_red_sm/PF00268_21/2_1e05Ribonuc_red_sm/PF00268_21/7_6e23_NODE_1698_length_3980_cov_284_047278_g1099_i02571504
MDTITVDGGSIIQDDIRHQLLMSQNQEMILMDNPSRWVLLPIEFPTLWEYYKKIERSFWTPEDFKWTQESDALKNAGISQANINLLLIMGATYNIVHGVPSPSNTDSHSDSALHVMFPDFLDLSCEFVEAIQTPEGRAYLGFQSMIENFHREVFTKWCEVVLIQGVSQSGHPSPAEKRMREIIPQILTHHELLQKQKWIHTHLEGFHYAGKVKLLAGDMPEYLKHMPTNTQTEVAPMAEILIAFAVMKGIFFTGLDLVPTICAGLDDSAFVHSAAKISRDMVLHGDFAAHLYSSLDRKFDLDTLKRLLMQAIELEYNFISTLFSRSGVTLNRADLGTLLRYKVHRLLRVFGYSEEDAEVLPSCSLPGEGLPLRFVIPDIIQFEHKGAFHIIPSELDPLASSNATTQAQLVTDEDF